VVNAADGNGRESKDSDRPPDHCRKDVEKPEDEGASLRGVWRRDFEFEEIETGEALDRGPASDRVMAGALARSRASRSLRDV